MTGSCPSSRPHWTESLAGGCRTEAGCERVLLAGRPCHSEDTPQESRAGSLPQPAPLSSFSEPSLLEMAHLIPFASLSGAVNKPVPGCKSGCHCAACLCFQEWSYLSRRAQQAGTPQLRELSIVWDATLS